MGDSKFGAKTFVRAKPVRAKAPLGAKSRSGCATFAHGVSR
jgi:hypothetical protein